MKENPSPIDTGASIRYSCTTVRRRVSNLANTNSSFRKHVMSSLLLQLGQLQNYRPQLVLKEKENARAHGKYQGISHNFIRTRNKLYTCIIFMSTNILDAHAWKYRHCKLIIHSNVISYCCSCYIILWLGAWWYCISYKNTQCTV